MIQKLHILCFIENNLLHLLHFINKLEVVNFNLFYNLYFLLFLANNNSSIGAQNFSGPPQQNQSNITASSQQYQMPSSNYALSSAHMQPSSHFGAGAPPIQKTSHMQQHSQPAQQQSQPQQTSPQSNANDDEAHQAQMLVKVLQLTDDQIRMLPPEDRAKVIELRNQLRRQVP